MATPKRIFSDSLTLQGWYGSVPVSDWFDEWLVQDAGGGDVSVSITGQGLSVAVARLAPLYDESTVLSTSIPDITFVPITEVMPINSGSSGQLNFSGVMEYTVTNETVNGTYGARLLWCYRTIGGSWTDVGTETTQTFPASVTGGALDNFGEISAAASQSGLSANTVYEVQLYLRRASGTPTNNIAAIPITVAVAAQVSGDVSVSVTGQALSASQGSVTKTLSVPVSGQAATLALQSTTTQKTLALPTGISAALSAGSLGTTKTLGLTGQSNALQTGAVTASTGATVSLSGISVPASIGSVTSSLSKALSGQAVTANTGTVTTTASYSVTLSGVSIALAAGTLASAISKAVSGQALSSSAGTVTVSTSATVNLTGQSAQVQTGTLSTSLTKALSGSSLSSSIGDIAPTYAADTISGIAGGTSFAAVTDILRVSSGSLGKLDFSGYIFYDVGTLTDGIYNAFAIWRYRTLGGSWVDVGTEIEAIADCRVVVGELDQLGEISATTTQSGLSLNTAYEVQLYFRRATSSPTNNIQAAPNLAEVTTGVADGTASITGVSTTVSSGSLTLTKTVTLSGQSASVQQQSIVSTRQAALAGQSTSIAQSSVVVQNSVVVSITGQNTTASRGSLGTTKTVAASGTSVAVQQGFTQVGSDVIVFLTGANAQLNLGTAVAGKQASISGVQSILNTGSLATARSLGINGAALLVFTGTITSTLPSTVTEYDVRLFDGLRAKGNQRGIHTTVRGLEYAMWARVLTKCEYVPYVYVAPETPTILRIGYGRPITETEAVEEANLSKNRETVWLNSKLTDLYKAIIDSNPTAELHEVLTSTLYYYQVECQKIA